MLRAIAVALRAVPGAEAVQERERELWILVHAHSAMDRFVSEAYAVLYLVPSDAPAVHYHYCGENLTPTGLSYENWLELLLRSRGASYSHTLATGPRTGDTWVDMNIHRIAKLFPDFDSFDEPDYPVRRNRHGALRLPCASCTRRLPTLAKLLREA